VSFEASHLRRMQDAAAIAGELLPSSAAEIEEIRGAYKNALRCKDRDLWEKADKESRMREVVYARLAGLWKLMDTAQDRRDETLSRATAQKMKDALHQEFQRREQQSWQP
jgi:hypothetical protein